MNCLSFGPTDVRHSPEASSHMRSEVTSVSAEYSTVRNNPSNMIDNGDSATARLTGYKCTRWAKQTHNIGINESLEAQ